MFLQTKPQLSFKLKNTTSSVSSIAQTKSLLLRASATDVSSSTTLGTHNDSLASPQTTPVDSHGLEDFLAASPQTAINESKPFKFSLHVKSGISRENIESPSPFLRLQAKGTFESDTCFSAEPLSPLEQMQGKKNLQ